MADTHCKVGRVRYKNNLVVYENPLHTWSTEAVGGAVDILTDAISEDNRADAVVVYLHFSDGTAVSHFNRHERCAIPTDLLGEVVKSRVNSMRNRIDARQIIYEELET